MDGRLFTWGRGKYGQLGHGDFRSASTPEPVKALLGSRLTQVTREGVREWAWKFLGGYWGHSIRGG